MAADSEFVAEAIAAGFSRSQAEWMEANIAEEGHTHEIEDVEELREELDALGADDLPDDGETP
jgi:hypothetical protein